MSERVARAAPAAVPALTPDQLHVLWHEVECGRYAQDLPLWRELATDANGPILDLGAGSGRVSLDLARAGHDVTALDVDPLLLAALAARAAREELTVETVQADAREFVAAVAGRTFALVLAPMQTIQLLGGSAGRARLLRSARVCLRPGGLLACALADALEGFDAAHTEPPLPDVLEQAGWVFASQPVAVRPDADGTTIERIRQTVSPDGARTAEGDAIRLDKLDGDTFEAEGVALGFHAAGRRFVEMTDEHVGSEVVLLAAPSLSPDAEAAR
ncbi:MAG TPA: class I SAM-dependent methyltransferase [Conexibacter sp.]|nr:class I SAM-dependent methyltransferase [Conexibacter sp.]